MQVIPLTDFQHGAMSFLAGVLDERLHETTAEELERKGLVRIKRAAKPEPQPDPRNQRAPDPGPDPFRRADGEGTPSASLVPALPSPLTTAPPFKRGPGRPRKIDT